ncbi:MULTISPECIES: response regulator [unclassified Leptolyngbya]|uniref:hybrid sensor histidine kinase/response regulator n=1 Tax=unclassified Leptolyngbya TaxID=2650499 RepID=UPI001682FF9C|nr:MULTISPECIES: response regulator [unclassified Leptolyngbya]MBD1909123.1 response regulator [Leptolyngbya sp. FACHB-8]MBD2157497.1 response regulator [Leptolyngbya sp. FACHB-16]
MLRLLLIDDNRDDRTLAMRQLKQAFKALQVTEVGTAAQFKQALAESPFDVVITDYQLRWSDGITVLKTIKAQDPSCPVIMFTNTATQDTALEAMKSGLDDYVIKSPSHYVRLPAAVETALERVAAQRQTASLQARIQALLNQLDVGVYRLTEDGSLLEGNAAFVRLLGLDILDELPSGQSLEPYFQPQDYTELLSQLKQNGNVRDREIQLRCADGKTRWVKISTTLTSAYGSTIIDGLIEDISQRKQAEAYAELEKQRSDFLAEASRLLTTSLDYRTTLENIIHLAVPSLADICIADVIEPMTLTFGEPIVATAKPEQVALMLELRRCFPSPTNAGYGAAKVLRTGQAELRRDIPASVLEYLAQDAKHLQLLQKLRLKSSITVPIRVANRTFGTITLLLTQTDRHYNQADLQMAEELARRTAIALDNARLYQEAQQANQTKDEFLAIVSHELRNPLNSMLGWAQLLRKRHFDDPIVSRAIETIERNAQLQNKLIEDLLDVSRIIRNKLEIIKQPVALVPTIDAVIQTFQPAAKSKSIYISSKLDPLADQVLGDAHRLEQIVSNLLSNAIKFTPSGGQVDVHLEQVGSFAQLTVADTGEGIKTDFLPFLFERFRQADSSKTRAQSGLGLGLAIVRHLVELHGGSVHASTGGEGQGATFVVQLPLHKASPIVSIEGREAGEGFPLLAGLRVLAVDDDSDNRELIAFILEEQQAEVVIAASAAEALDIMQRWDADILISDIGMPEEDGYSLIRKIRALPCARKREIPAIALTAFAKEEDNAASAAAGFQRHLSKPVNPDDLLAVVTNLATPSIGI